jgi:hypothetical protein
VIANPAALCHCAFDQKMAEILGRNPTASAGTFWKFALAVTQRQTGGQTGFMCGLAAVWQRPRSGTHQPERALNDALRDDEFRRAANGLFDLKLFVQSGPKPRSVACALAEQL